MSTLPDLPTASSTKFWYRLTCWQIQTPWVLIAIALILTVISAVFATKLELKTQFEQLLPEHQPSVIEFKRVVRRAPGLSNIFIVLEGNDSKTLRTFGDTLVLKLREVGPPWVSSVEDGVHATREFLQPRAGLFTSLEELRKLKTDVDEHWEYEVAKQIGADFADPPKPLTADRLKARFKIHDSQIQRFPDGYYQSPDGKTLIVIARSAIISGDLEGARTALSRVQSIVSETHKTPAFMNVHVGYAGDLVTVLFEYGSVRNDLLNVGALGIGLVLGVVFLFYRRMRALVAMGLTIGVGLCWTFGITRFAIGHLNIATGFLVSIVAGNGINCGIIYMARYFEERSQGKSIEHAVFTAHTQTWTATLMAALAAAAAYGSLAITDFRGFKHFALIGACGMIVCWLATYLLTPCILALYDRWRPFKAASKSMRTTRYDAPFTWLVSKTPRALSLLGVVFALLGIVATVRYVRSSPMEYNMRRLQNNLGESTEIYRISALARDLLGVHLESSMVVLADRLEQVKPLKQSLEARIHASKPEERPFEAVHTLLDFIPDQQNEKLPLLNSIAETLRRARAKKFITDADWKDLQQWLPKQKIEPFSIHDLPEELARPFTDREGKRGLLLYIEPTAGQNDNDLHYLMRWADSFRETHLPSGEIIRGSGRAIIFADMLKAVVHDIPKAVLASFLMTALVVFVVFRRGKQTLWVVFALLIGVAWVGIFLLVGHIKIHFLNFIALPITFGIGVDYAVNIVQRHHETQSVVTTLQGTGGAVVLCSLTTMLGYLALLGSLNQAVRSLGTVAVIGEICCLLAAIVVLPAMLIWAQNRSLKTEGS